jgi:aminopeptidase 2
MTSGKNIAHDMSIWTGKVGYPILTVTENEGEQKIVVRQDRFLRSNDFTKEENQTIYPVSLGLITSTGTKEILLDQREKEIALDQMRFFKLNAGQSSFYRTLYTPERLVKLGEAMKSGLLAVEDRIGVIAEYVFQQAAFCLLPGH